MTSRIDARFAKLKAQKRAGLVTFTMAYDPSLEVSQTILEGLPAAGADIIEIGIPFSDPMADGKTIQAAGIRALAQGANLPGILGMVTEFRKKDGDTPIILMGYYNPIYRYGAERFAQDAARAGVDGTIIVDLPPEEEAEVTGFWKQQNISLVRLATPTSSDDRLPALLANISGFIYYVSITGITGTGSADMGGLGQRVAHLKSKTTLPIAVGFGIRTPQQVKEISQFADAVVVGSSIVSVIEEHQGNAGQCVDKTLTFVRSLSAAL